MFINHYLWYY